MRPDTASIVLDGLVLITLVLIDTRRDHAEVVGRVVFMSLQLRIEAESGTILQLRHCNSIAIISQNYPEQYPTSK